MSDIIKRLRGHITKAPYAQWCPIDFDLELAAEEIERLRAELARALLADVDNAVAAMESAMGQEQLP